MKKLNLKTILSVVLGAAALYWLYKRSQRPSNFSSLTGAQQAQYNSLLNGANLSRALGINSGLE